MIYYPDLFPNLRANTSSPNDILVKFSNVNISSAFKAPSIHPRAYFSCPLRQKLSLLDLMRIFAPEVHLSNDVKQNSFCTLPFPRSDAHSLTAPLELAELKQRLKSLLTGLTWDILLPWL